MARKESKDKKSGCFQWVVSFGRSVNERWAQFRNRFRERFRRSNPTVHTTDPLNETGTPDLIFSKRPVSPKIDAVVVEHLTQAVHAGIVQAISGHSLTDIEAEKLAESEHKVVTATSHHSVHDQEIREFAANYVKDIVHGSQAKLQAEARVVSPTPSAISGYAERFALKVLYDEKAKLEAESRILSPDSITSSVAEEIADIAVQESLSNIVADPNMTEDTIVSANLNESAKRRPKTVGEIMTSLGFGACGNDDGLPRVDI